MNLTKEQFVEAIHDIELTLKYNEEFYKYQKKNLEDEYVEHFDCVGSLMNLLRIYMNDIEGWIEYFCLDIDFGRKFNKEDFLGSEYPRDFSLTSPEELYDLLLEG